LPKFMGMTRMPSNGFCGGNYDVNATGWTCELHSGQHQTHDSFPERSNGDRDECSSIVTTLLLRNVPRRYKEAAILLELEAFVDLCDYDLIYLPWDTHKAENIGFVFINFVSETVAARVYKQMNGAHWREEKTGKVIKIMPAHCQGLAANIAQYASTRVVMENHQHTPMVFVNGSHITFQEAVKLFFPPGLHQSPKPSTAAHVQSDKLCSWQQRCSHSSSRCNMLSMSNTAPQNQPVDVRSSREYHKSWKHINMQLQMLLGCGSHQHTKCASTHFY